LFLSDLLPLNNVKPRLHHSEPKQTIIIIMIIAWISLTNLNTHHCAGQIKKSALFLFRFRTTRIFFQCGVSGLSSSPDPLANYTQVPIPIPTNDTSSVFSLIGDSIGNSKYTPVSIVCWLLSSFKNNQSKCADHRSIVFRVRFP
jgi:hypothetical protein